MALLVSRLEPSPNDPKVLLTKESRDISCLVKDGRAEIVSSAYTTEELERLLPGLLRAIKDKKKLLNRSSKGDSYLFIEIQYEYLGN
jgi:hypothetical protein